MSRGVPGAGKTSRVLAVASFFLAGTVIGLLVPRSREFAGPAGRWVVAVALPALILARLPELELGRDAAVPVATAWATIIVGASVVWAVSRRAGWPSHVTGALLMVVPLGNTSFLGLPVVEAVLGRDHLPAALAFDQVGTFLALATYGTWVSGRLGSGGGDAGATLRRLVTFPPFVALVGSLVFRAVDMPGAARDALVLLGRTVAPVAMVSLGLRFVPRLRIAHTSAVVLGIAVKMLLLPVLVAGAAVVLGDPTGTAWAASIVEASMPPMVTAGVIGVAAGFDEDLTANLVAAGTVLALVFYTVVSLRG
jgi:predicted permease